MQAHNKVLWDQRRERNYFGERDHEKLQKRSDMQAINWNTKQICPDEVKEERSG